MSQKKHKKRNSNSGYAGKDPMKLQQTSKNKKADPLTRNILLSDLVILAASMVLQEHGMIGEKMATVVTIVGVIMLVVALYLLFGPQKRINGGPKQ